MITCGNKAQHGAHRHFTVDDVRACCRGAQISLFFSEGEYIGSDHYDDDVPAPAPVYAVLREGQYPCTWLVRVVTEDGYSERECGLPMDVDDRGHRCPRHEHVNADTRRAEGWDYAEDDGDAMALTAGGIEPRDMQGRIYI